MAKEVGLWPKAGVWGLAFEAPRDLVEKSHGSQRFGPSRGRGT